MEAVEDVGQLLGRDGLALVADGDVGLAPLGGDLQGEQALGGGELHGVVQQVVAHLGDGVRVAPDHHRAVGEVGLDVQVLLGDLGLQAHQHPQEDLLHVELLLGGHPLRGLEPGELQHPADQTGQAAGLRGDDLEGFPLLLRGNGAVQDALGKAGDGGHGGLELVGDVGHELAALLLRLGQGVGHGVEGLGQLADLIGAAGILGEAGLKLAPGELVGRLAHAFQGVDDPLDSHRAQQDGDQQDGGGRDQEELEGVFQEGQGGSGVGGHKEDAQRTGAGDLLPGEGVHRVGNDGDARDEALRGEETVEGGGAAVGILLDQLVHHPLRHIGPLNGVLLRKAGAGGVENPAVGLAQEDGGVRDHGHRGQVGPEVLAGEGHAVADGRVGIGRDVGDIPLGGLLALILLIAEPQGQEAGAQEGHGEDDEADDEGQLPGVHAGLLGPGVLVGGLPGLLGLFGLLGLLGLLGFLGLLLGFVGHRRTPLSRSAVQTCSLRPRRSSGTTGR